LTLCAPRIEAVSLLNTSNLVKVFATLQNPAPGSPSMEGCCLLIQAQSHTFVRCPCQMPCV
jgi:hypothetical protein